MYVVVKYVIVDCVWDNFVLLLYKMNLFFCFCGFDVYKVNVVSSCVFKLIDDFLCLDWILIIVKLNLCLCGDGKWLIWFCCVDYFVVIVID